jgi:hypothetical protein
MEASASWTFGWRWKELGPDGELGETCVELCSDVMSSFFFKEYLLPQLTSFAVLTQGFATGVWTKTEFFFK